MMTDKTNNHIFIEGFGFSSYLKNIILLLAFMGLIGGSIWLLNRNTNFSAQPNKNNHFVIPINTVPPTPSTPNEAIIAAFNVSARGFAISPDDHTLAVSIYLTTATYSLIPQLLTIDLPSQTITPLNVAGENAQWSPDGQQILFSIREGKGYNLNVISKDGTNLTTLLNIAYNDLLDYYWDTSTEVAVVKSDGIHYIEVDNKAVRKTEVSIPPKTKGGLKAIVRAYPDDTILVGDGHSVLAILVGRQNIVFEDDEGFIDKFERSPDGKKIAYVIVKGTSDELWISNLENPAPVQYYKVGHGHIHNLKWHPNGQTVLLGWRETGTSWAANLHLLQININTKDQYPLIEDLVDTDFVFNHQGNILFYARTFYRDSFDAGQTIIYRVDMKK